MGIDRLTPFRDAILERWLVHIWNSYPDEAAKFMRETRDHFANPVGSIFKRETEQLMDGLFEERPPELLAAHVEPMIRIRAVQEFSPSRAVAFIPRLKEFMREEAEKVGGDDSLVEVLEEFDRRVDHLLMVAFDVYVKCREELFEIRVNEVRNRSMKVMERLNQWRERRDRKVGDTAAASVGDMTD
jgi:hypothetical protein